MTEPNKPTKRVTGLGGVFMRCQDKAKLQSWYREHLGIDSSDYGFQFLWREDQQPDERGYTVWGTFSSDTEYFGNKEQPYMLNYRVADLEALVAALKEEGVEIAGGIDVEENGKFAWIIDLEGNRVELWEPVPSAKDPYLA